VFDPSERIKINNTPVRGLLSDSQDFLEKTHIALKEFDKHSLDVVILEVGIGGRLDPVNLLVEPDISVITNIDFDHQERLGNSLDQIGLEKAHVYRPNKPSIFGSEFIPKSVIDYAHKINTELFRYNINFSYKVYEDHWEFISHKKNINYKNLPMPDYLTLHNAVIALETLSHLPLNITREHIKQGLTSAYLPGRFKIISHPVTQIFDVAHNPASALLLADKLKKLPCEGKTFSVVDIKLDKDIPGTLKPLLNTVDTWLVGSKTIGAYLPNSVLFDDIHIAYQQALKLAGPKDRVVIFGSFRTVGALCPDRN